MKFLKSATFVFALLFFVLPPRSSFGFDLEQLTTSGGTRYYEVVVLNADEHGLMFRHAHGIAKLAFSELSENLRMLYEPVAHLSFDSAAGGKEDNPATEGPAVEAERESLFDGIDPSSAPLIVTVRTRVTLPPATPCAFCPNAAWQPHWSRFFPAYFVTTPCRREMALRNLLQATGRRSFVAHSHFRPWSGW